MRTASAGQASPLWSSRCRATRMCLVAISCSGLWTLLLRDSARQSRGDSFDTPVLYYVRCVSPGGNPRGHRHRVDFDDTGFGGIPAILAGSCQFHRITAGVTREDGP